MARLSQVRDGKEVPDGEPREVPQAWDGSLGFRVLGYRGLGF